MGHLAFLGSHKVNGVSALHTELMRKTVFQRPERALSGPHRQQDQRHHLPPLAASGKPAPYATSSPRRSGRRSWTIPTRCAELEPLADDAAFQDRFAVQRRAANKETLARLIAERLQVSVDPAALFDVQIKRIHEYKRQLLNILETIALYQAIKAEPRRDWQPRVKIFAGKAAASYARAKLIIKLANDVARVVNATAMCAAG